ncbi:MAG: hypothetical protein ABSA77_05655 [Thermoguttaceae bacterium]|jgi:hypothetical protein
MEFQQRLQKAIERGQRAGIARAQAERDRTVNEKELQRLHTLYRLELSERIERCLKNVAEQFPGFQFESIVDERGWGGAISRDDLRMNSSGRTTGYSRLEMLIRPFSSSQVLELTSKATVMNREVFHRSHYHGLADADLISFNEMIDNWALEFAEQYAGKK